jgi:hypothetical protein
MFATQHEDHRRPLASEVTNPCGCLDVYCVSNLLNASLGQTCNRWG